MGNAWFSNIRRPDRAGPRAGRSRHRRDDLAQAAAAVGSVSVALVLAGCASPPAVIPVETPVLATFDVSPFSRVLVAGFIGGGSDEIDANVETTRLLKSQLRNGSRLKVVDASDALPLLEMTTQTRREAAVWGVVPAGVRAVVSLKTPKIPKSEEELKTHEWIFSDVAFWKRIGEEYQQPIIITGTVFFTAEARYGLVAREREVIDAAGRRRLESKPALVQGTVHTLKPRFVFIDGRTGSIVHAESFQEQTVSSESQRVPALSAYFQLMDRVVPEFVGTFTNHKVRGYRALLR